MKNDKRSTRSSVLLTHWDPGFYRPNQVPRSIAELAAYALTYDEVVIRSIDVILNSGIGKHLWADAADQSLFVELVSSGCVKIQTLHPEGYPADIRANPETQPFTARVEDQSKHRTFAGDPWKPEDWQWDLCRILDGAISRESLRFPAAYPKTNDFATFLAHILENRNSYELWAMPQFKDIDDRIADAFIRFCKVPEAWKKALVDGGITPTTRNEFFRSEAYLCTRLFPNQKGIMNLSQSVYMSLECRRDGREGRYGGGLWEPPYRLARRDIAEAGECAKRLQVVPASARRVILPLGPGIGKAIAATRMTAEFRAFQKVLKHVADAPLSEREFTTALEGVGAAFASASAATMLAKRTRLEQWIADFLPLVYATGQHCGWQLAMRPGSPSDPILDWAVGTVFAKLAEQAARIVRSGLFIRSAREAVINAITIRCSDIDLENEKKMNSEEV